MPKTFITEKEIDDMARQGIKSLTVDENTVLTALACEAVEKHGITLINQNQESMPCAPVRPYLSEKQTVKPASTAAAPTKTPPPPTALTPAAAPAPSIPIPKKITSPTPPHLSIAPSFTGKPAGLEERIRFAVTTELGQSIDREVLDHIIQRVLKSTGLG